MNHAKLKEVATALREGCEMMPATGRKRSEWIGRASHLCADLGLAMLVQEAKEKEPPKHSPEVQALIQAAKLAEELITDAKCVQSVKWTNARTDLRSALKPFTESSPEPLRPREPNEMEKTLLALIDTIDSTGGVDKDTFAPEGDPDWIDLGEVYMSACAVMDHPPKFSQPTES